MNLHKLVEQVEVHARPAQQRRFRDVDGRPIREVEPSSGKKGRVVMAARRDESVMGACRAPLSGHSSSQPMQVQADTQAPGAVRHTQQQQIIIISRSQTTGSVSRKARFGRSTCAGGPLIMKNAVSGAAPIEEEEEENGRAAPFAMNYACPTPRVTSERQQRAPHARKKGVPRRGGRKPRNDAWYI